MNAPKEMKAVLLRRYDRDLAQAIDALAGDPAATRTAGRPSARCPDVTGGRQRLPRHDGRRGAVAGLAHRHVPEEQVDGRASLNAKSPLSNTTGAISVSRRAVAR